MTDLTWIDTALKSARPQAMAALLRYFRGDLDRAEEAFQESCLRALKHWPEKGPPRDPAAWLIFVGRNSGVDDARRSQKHVALPDDDSLTTGEDVQADMAERLDGEQYRDDILRLLFICCHPELPYTQQIALALRIVSGLTVAEIASAFLVSEAAMEQRITRAKRRIGEGAEEFATPGAAERGKRLNTVLAMLYLLFNEGYSASGGEAHIRSALCEEAIRLMRLLLRLFPAEPEVLGLTALLLLQHARAEARLDDAGEIILMEDQDRACWNAALIKEGSALLDKAMQHASTGPYQVQAAIAALHASAKTAAETDWAQIDRLYATLEVMTPSPVVTLNRAVAVSKAKSPEAALDLIAPLSGPLDGYFHFHGVTGALLKQMGRKDEARTAFNRAIALARTPAEAAHIRLHLDQLARG